MSKAEFHDALELPTGTMTKLNKGEEVSLATLLRICKCFKCNIAVYPYQITAARFAVRNPYQKGVILCDEAGIVFEEANALSSVYMHENTFMGGKRN